MHIHSHRHMHVHVHGFYMHTCVCMHARACASEGFAHTCISKVEGKLHTARERGKAPDGHV